MSETYTVEIFRVRNHALPIEEDPVDIVEFAGLSGEQVAMLQAVVDDSVWYDMKQIES